MAEPSTHINYSLEDIRRYVKGKMSATEMHDVEKATLKDSFLADAIEGFNEADFLKAQQHLNEINAALITEKKESKVVAFNKKLQWLNIAALVIVLAGVGIIVSYFFKSSTNKQTQIAQVKNEPVKNKILKDSANSSNNTLAQKPDTATLLIAQNKSEAKSKRTVTKKDQGNNVSSEKTLDEDKDNVTSITVRQAQSNQIYPSLLTDTTHYNLTSTKINDSTYNNQYALQGKASGISILPLTFTGKVFNKNGEPIPFATIRVNDKQSVAADTEGYFSLKNIDTPLSVITSAIGYVSNKSVIKPVTQNIIVLNKTNNAINDVVVTTALGVSRKNKSLANSAIPKGGWENFNHYVISKLNADTTKQEDFYENNFVELEFMIDNSGNPYDIEVVKSLDDKKDSLAIDILKAGPKWINTRKHKKARVAISFNPQ